MTTAIIVFRLLAVSQILFFAGAIGFSSNPRHVKALGMLLALGIIAYLIVPLLYDHGSPMAGGAALLASTIPLTVLLFVWAVFEDEPIPPVPMMVAGVLYLAGLLWVELSWISLYEAGSTWAVTLYQSAKLLLAAWALLIVVKGRASDLIEARLRIRTILSVLLGVMVVAVVTIEVAWDYDVPLMVELAGMGLIFIASLTVNLVFLISNPRLVLISIQNAAPPVSEDEPLFRALQDLMQVERLYADHDLRIRDLADRLKIPEYKLRRMINQRLGHRNFNQYINSYRIAEASERLLAERELPVLTIALDVGFRSISSFNAAFRALHGCSPTEYRNLAAQSTE